MQESSPVRLPRHSDGDSRLPPASTPRNGKRSSRRKKGLNTLSAPLTPHAGVHGPLDPRSPTHQQQQQQRKQNKPPAAASATPSRLGGRRNTVSDTGQSQQQAKQLQPQHAALVHSLSSKEQSSSSSRILEPVEQAERSSFTQQAVTDAAGVPKAVQQLHWQQQHPQPQVTQQQQLQQQILAGPPPPAGPPALPQGPFSTGAPTAGSSAPRAVTLQHAGSLEGPYLDPPPTLWEFFHAEATPHEKYPTADVLWRQTERDRVYNFLLYVPYQLERIMVFGTLLCFYSFLGALTALPLRCLWAIWQLLSKLLLPGSRSRSHGSNDSSSSNSSSNSRASLLPGALLYDLLCALLMLGAVVVLSQIKPGVLYYWMKDITSEFLKIQVLFTALEICDKILSNFGVDVLEALSSTCTLYTQSSIGLMQLLSDLLVAFLLITAHGGVLMCQAMVFAVTMNSKRNALLALMIATNFVELKGQVYKRTDTNKLWALACQDIVERFQLLLVLCFVVVEDISNSGTWWPAPGTLLECGRIFLWEIVIDITKHAVLGKFNDIRPGIYREYMRDLCSDSLDKHSHNIHKLLGFCPLGPAALSLRMVHTLFTLKCDGRPDWQLRSVVLLLSWMASCATQVVLGYSLKWLAYLYVQRHALQAGGKVLPRAINVTPSGIKLFGPAGTAAAVSTASKGTAAAAAAAAGLQNPAVSMAALNSGFSPKGVQARVTGAATAASGGSPLAGASPSHSPKGCTHPLLLSAQLPMPGGVFGSSSGVAGSSRPSSASSLHVTAAQNLRPNSAGSIGAVAVPGAVPVQGPAAGEAYGLPSGGHGLGMVIGSSGSGSGSFCSTGSFVNNPAALAASLAANSAPTAGNALAVAAAGGAAAAGALPAVNVHSGPLRMGLSLAQRAGSTPDSPFSSNSQLQPFGERQVDARASFSDARPGWESAAAVSSSFDTAGAAAALADVFAARAGPVAVSTADGSSSCSVMGEPVGGLGGQWSSAGHSSGYAGVSAAGLVGRAYRNYSTPEAEPGVALHLHQQQQQQVVEAQLQQQHQEQEWQQPKGRHRAKHE